MKKLTLLLLLIAPAISLFGQAGTVDSSFGTAGKYEPAFIARPSNCVLQSDEKIIQTGTAVNILGESRFYLTRYLPDGGVDVTFGTSGSGYMFPEFSTAFYVMRSVVQADDKIVLAGVTSGNNQQVVVGRFNADGTPDSTFAGIGNRIMSIPGNVYNIAAIKIKPDGKIIIAGGNGTPNPGQNPFTLQLLPDGTLDNAYGTNGVKIIDDLGYATFISDLDIQTDGKAVAVLDNTNIGTISQFYVLRLNTDGSRDNSFGTNGLVITGFGIPSSSKSLLIQSDGKILVAGLKFYNGFVQTEYALARYFPDGSPDSEFGDMGKVTLHHIYSLNRNPFAVVEQPNHQLVLATDGITASNGLNDFVVARFNADGSPDAAFGNGGYVLTDFDSLRNFPADAYVLNNGKILVTGFSMEPVPSLDIHPVMARYNSCGVNISTQPHNTGGSEGVDAEFTVAIPNTTATFQWQKENASNWESLNDGGLYSGTHTNTLHISMPMVANNGEQYRCLIFTGNCTDTSDAATLNVVSMSAEDVTVAQGLNIFPNPANDKLQVVFNSYTKASEYNITDPAGRKVSEGKFSNSRNTLDISKLAPGLYFLTIEHGAVYKFVKG